MLLERLITKVMQKAMDFAEKVIGKNTDDIKEMPKESGSGNAESDGTATAKTFRIGG